MQKNKRLLVVSLLMVLMTIMVLGLRVGYPHHRFIGFVLLSLVWVPLVVSCRINRSLLQQKKIKIKEKTRPFSGDIAKKNKVRASLTNFFKKRRCFTFPRPAETITKEVTP